MILIPDKKIRRYISYENGKWIHDPNMPRELIPDFNKFLMQYNETLDRGHKIGIKVSREE